MDRNVLVYGASGHGKVVAEIATALGLTLRGFVDDGVPVGTKVLGAEVLGGWDWLVGQPRDAVVVLGIGANPTRERVMARVRGAGFAVETVVHPAAWVSPSARLGPGTVVMAGAVINADARIGEGVIVNSRAIVEHECVIGDFAHLSPGAALGGGVRVGARSHVGLNAAVKQLVSIGSGVTVGAGAVVVKDVGEGLTVVGVPARPMA